MSEYTEYVKSLPPLTEKEARNVMLSMKLDSIFEKAGWFVYGWLAGWISIPVLLWLFST